MFFRQSCRARFVRPSAFVRAPFTNRFLHWRAAAGLIISMSLPASVALAATCEQTSPGKTYCEPAPELWGNDIWGGKYLFPSYEVKKAEIMSMVLWFVGPGAEPVYGPRENLPPPDACGFCSDTAYTHQADETNGYVYAEAERP